VQRAQFGTRRQAEVGRQALGELAIGQTRRAGLAVASQRTHVVVQRRFVQWVGLEQPGRQCDGLGRFESGIGQLRQRRATPGGTQALALERDPARPGLAFAIVEARQQLAAIGGQRVRGALLAQRRLEHRDIGGHVDPQRRAL
jgi:hypothetical protein